MRKFLLAVLYCALATVTLSAQQASLFSFLRSTISARQAALGGATVSMTKDVSTIVMNPAALYTIDSAVVSATFIKHVSDINSGYAVFGTQWQNVGRVAVTASYTSYGTFDRTTWEGDIIGQYTAADVVMGVSISREIDSLISYGATVKYMHSSFDNEAATAIAADVGLLIQIPQSRTNIGISLLNAGVQLATYDGTKDRLPLDLRAGVNHRLRGLPLLVNFSLNHLTDEVESFGARFLNFSLGGELYIGKYAQLRLGYDNSTRNQSSVDVATQLTGLSGGIGVQLPTVSVDYAMSSLGSSALLHRFSVALGL